MDSMLKKRLRVFENLSNEKEESKKISDFYPEIKCIFKQRLDNFTCITLPKSEKENKENISILEILKPTNLGEKVRKEKLVKVSFILNFR